MKSSRSSKLIKLVKEQIRKRENYRYDSEGESSEMDEEKSTCYEGPANSNNSEDTLITFGTLQPQKAFRIEDEYAGSPSLPQYNLGILADGTSPDKVIEEPDPLAAKSTEEALQTAKFIMNDVFETVWKSIRPLKRWQGAGPANWAINIEKRRRIEGLPYMFKKKILPPKLPQAIECNTCTFKCTTFSSEERNKLCRYYWNLDFKGKKNFLLLNIRIQAPKKIMTTRKPNRKPRTYAKSCFLQKNDEAIQVCQRFFCKTLCISPDVIRRAIEKRTEVGLYVDIDKRGQKVPPNKTKPDIVKHVKSHIESFPCMEAHYARNDSKHKYLDRELSIKKMYQLYLESCEENNILEPVSEITYRRIFRKDFNLSFFVPKKDQCLVCTNYDKANASKKLELQLNYEQHIERKTRCNEEKLKEKEKANNDKDYMSVTFDLQAVLQIPSGKVGLLHYTRKLCVFNLTICEAPLPNAGYCFTWSEVNGKNGSCEIGSILYHYLKHCLPDNIKKISLYSDTCGGQNRNQYVAALLLWTVQSIENLHIIEQKYLESGHTNMEVDSMHSSIDTAKRYTSIYGMPDWISIFQRARCRKTRKINKKKVVIEPYNVKEFKFNEFFDLKSLADKMILNKTKDNKGNTVQWLKIKRMRYVKGEKDKIFFNYDMSENFLHINISTKYTLGVSHSNSTRNENRSSQNSPAQSPNFENDQLKPLYNGPLPISIAKKNDLVKLCQEGVIPEEFHGWFNSLGTSSTAVDRLPEPAVGESSDEEYY